MKTANILIAAGIIVISATSCSKDALDNNAAQSNNLLNDPTARATVSSNFRNLLLASASGNYSFDDNVTYTDADGDKIWVHIENGDAKTLYQPRDWKHIDEGFETTKYIPDQNFHVEEGIDKTRLVPLDAEHREEGFDKTHWLPPSYQHIIEGPNKTGHTMDGYNHIETGPNQTYFEKK